VGKAIKFNFVFCSVRNAWEKETFDSVLNFKYIIYAVNFQWHAQNLLWPCHFLSLSYGPLETWCGPMGGHWPTLRNIGIDGYRIVG
jgi:hypothetical protein